MSYIRESLGDGERVIGAAHFHVTYQLGALLLALPIAAVPLTYALMMHRGYAPDQIVVILGMLGGLALVCLPFFVAMTIRYNYTEIGVTNRRFILKTGFLTLKTQEIAIPNIESVQVQQGFWGKVFGFGRLSVEGTGVGAIKLPTIADPVAFRRAIENARSAKS